MKRIVLGVLLIICANVFRSIPEGPTAFSLPFTWIGIALVLYGASSIKGQHEPV